MSSNGPVSRPGRQLTNRNHERVRMERSCSGVSTPAMRVRVLVATDLLTGDVIRVACTETRRPKVRACVHRAREPWPAVASRVRNRRVRVARRSLGAADRPAHRRDRGGPELSCRPADRSAPRGSSSHATRNCACSKTRDSPTSASTPSPSSSRCAAPTSYGMECWTGASTHARPSSPSRPTCNSGSAMSSTGSSEPHRHDGEIHVRVSVRIASGRRG